MRRFGAVDYFNTTKLYGFIRELRDHGTSQFFHVSDVQGRILLNRGDIVTFEIVPSPKRPDQTCAVRIRLSKRDELPATTDASDAPKVGA